MKKVLLSALVASVMSTCAFAGTITGTIETVTANAYGVVKIVVRKTDDTLSYPKTILGSADAKKSMAAVALTAKASTRTVDVVTGDFDGETGCVSIVMK